MWSQFFSNSIYVFLIFPSFIFVPNQTVEIIFLVLNLNYSTVKATKIWKNTYEWICTLKFDTKLIIYPLLDSLCKFFSTAGTYTTLYYIWQQSNSCVMLNSLIRGILTLFWHCRVIISCQSIFSLMTEHAFRQNK